MAPRDNNRLQSEIGLRGTDFDAALGMRVRVRRTLLGLSQADLARRLPFSQQRIALLERGEGRLFASDLYILGRVLGVPVDFFFGSEKQQPLIGDPAAFATHMNEPTLLDTGLDTERDWRLDREVRVWVKAFLRIPSSTNRSRLLAFIMHLASQADSDTQMKLLENHDE